MAAGRLRGEALDKPRGDGTKAERAGGAKAERAGGAGAKAERAGGGAEAERAGAKAKRAALDTPRRDGKTHAPGGKCAIIKSHFIRKPWQSILYLLSDLPFPAALC